MILMKEVEADRSLKSHGIPWPVFPFFTIFAIQLKGWLLLVSSHLAELVLQRSWRGALPVCSLHSLLPSHPALMLLCCYLHYVLASDRNLELSGLGINCLNAFVQIASLTSYLKCFLKYTGALCKLLDKL